MLIDTMAWGSCSRGRISPTAEFQAGDSSAVQQPVTKVSSRMVAGPAQPTRSSRASSSSATVCTASAARMSRRRSVVSASTPAGRESTNMGRNTAVCTSAASREEPCSTMIQAAAMACMALAMKYSALVTHSRRKVGWRRVSQMEGGGASVGLAGGWGRDMGSGCSGLFRERSNAPSRTAERGQRCNPALHWTPDGRNQ
jgi:hypothetical protein